MNIIRHIPNTITSMNLFCGVLGVVFTFQGALDIAFYLMLAAAVCDFLDGFAARLLKAYSDMGKELDSLADLISFGVLPAMMFHRRLVEGGMTGVWTYLPLIICVFSALRLAKFNIDTRQSENFIGLATPSCALICGSLIYASEMYPWLHAILVAKSYIVPMISLVLCYLLICEIPMFSFKFKSLKWADNSARFTFLGLVVILGIAILVMGLNWSLFVLAVFTAYILVNVISAVFHK